MIETLFEGSWDLKCVHASTIDQLSDKENPPLHFKLLVCDSTSRNQSSYNDLTNNIWVYTPLYICSWLDQIQMCTVGDMIINAGIAVATSALKLLWVLLELTMWWIQYHIVHTVSSGRYGFVLADEPCQCGTSLTLSSNIIMYSKMSGMVNKDLSLHLEL